MVHRDLLILPEDLAGLIRYIEVNRLNFHIIKYFSIDLSENAILKDLGIRWAKECFKYEHSVSCALMALNRYHESSGNKFLLIKTLSSYSHSTSDIDVLVEGDIVKDEMESYFKENSWYKSNDLTLSSDCGEVELDIQSKVSWTNSDDLSSDFIWSNYIESSFNGVYFLQPNAPADSLLRLGHMPFEQAEVRLGELLHIYSQMRSLDFGAMQEEAKACGWPSTYRSILGLVISMHLTLYGFSPLIKSNEVRLAHMGKIKFPYGLSYGMMARGVFEKKAWGKIWGARYILRDRLMGILNG